MEPLEPDDPRRIGRFALLGVLGQGGMGRVYVGRSAGGRRVAVKVVHEFLARTPEFRIRFRREIEAARRLNSMYVAPLVDCDAEAPLPWMATQLIDGPTLREEVDAGGPLSRDRTLVIALGLAEALQKIHEDGWVHRDLKPSNMIIDRDGLPRIIDFGIISRVVEDTGATVTGRPLGTRGYMSPEQAEGLRTDSSTDIYAFGATVYFAVTGRPPDGPGTGDPDVSAIDDADLADVVRACLSRDPRQRPTAAALVHRLIAVLDPEHASDSSPTAPGTTRSSVTADPMVTADPVAAAAGANGARTPRRRLLMLAMVAAIATVLGVAGVVLWPGEPSPVVLRGAGWREFFNDPELQRILRRNGLIVEMDDHSGTELQSLAAGDRYDFYLAPSEVTRNLLIRVLDRQGIPHVAGEVFREQMVLGTYAPVREALADDPSHRLARKGTDGIVRLDTHAFAESVAAHADRTGTGLRWGDVPGFPSTWDHDDPVSIAQPSPCTSAGGVTFIGMLARDLLRDTDVPGGAPARTARAERAVRWVFTSDTPGHSKDLLQQWAVPAGTPPAPLTFMYEHDALTWLATSPGEPSAGRRVLVYLDAPVESVQSVVVRDSPAGNVLKDLLTGTSPDALRLRALQTSRFGLRYGDAGARRALQSYVAQHSLGEAIRPGGADATVAGPATRALPSTDVVDSLVRGLCPRVP